jgi:UrcA family protein
MNMYLFTNLSIIAAIALLPFAAANATDENRTIRVRTHDINISSTHGQKILAVLTDRAAREVCDFANDRLDRQIRKIERKCRDEAKASAWASVETDAHLSKR